ncbi:PBP2a family beta-lactam-resistant peptidoglycan transpeptidase [Staphylococcus simulans]|uniref:PBP2a family beta-lactam-resistant peptidoglycan transpeptidase n=1 Tax=Staphylococcus simulans TaxID=1286 RepID=UPI0021CED021|nr:PBP2a family beta-lactam-resistant peptidoglycan transpeptidase [Staphylococcus simulans]UXR45224.1 PBP2a family beta-lactam-resistant peptidoglycan transpeptidase [Staphylococcus simulans]
MKKFVFFLLLLVCIVGLIFFTNRNKEINSIINDIENRRDKKIYAGISTQSKIIYNRNEIINRTRKIYKDLGLEKIEISDRKIERVSLNEKRAVVRYILYTNYGKIERKQTLKFIKEHDGWKLKWDPEVIIPGMSENQKINIKILESERGKILDRNGVELANTGNAYEIGLIPQKTPSKMYSQIADGLNISENSIKNKVNQKWVKKDHFVPIKTVKEINKPLSQLISKYKLSFHSIKERNYPFNQSTTHLLGYVGPINPEELNSPQFKGYDNHSIIGKKGIERLYDHQLQNKDGYKIYASNDFDDIPIDTLIEKKPSNGKNIKLTIDSRVQNSIYKHMNNDYGSGTAINPHTGEILALVSTPSYDIYPFMHGISFKEYSRLINDEKEPLLNKFQTTSSPGSTQKILTAIIGLNERTLTNNTSYIIKDKGWQKDKSWGDYFVTRFQVVNGSIDLKQAIESSDNIFFAKVALALGSQNFEKGMKRLGVGEKIPSDYPFYEAQISNKNLQNEILLADSGYGQGEILINPIQILSIYSALENNGNIPSPHVLKKTKTKIWKENIVSKHDIKILTDGMERVVNKTHREDIYRSYANIIGKSGTAELKMKQGEKGKQIGWFISYNKENTNMMLAINVKDVQDKGMASYNAKISGKIYDDLYHHGKNMYTIEK